MYNVSLKKCPSFDILGDVWKSLEVDSDCSFFQTWDWISNWVKILPKNVNLKLLKIEKDSDVVALGLFVDRYISLHKFLPLPIHQLFLNETGIPEIDKLSIEYNGLLCNKYENKNQLTKFLLKYLMQNSTYEKIFLSGMDPNYSKDFTLPSNFVLNRNEDHHFFVNLDELRIDNKEYTSILSRKNRLNIRKAMERFQTLGDITIQNADTVDQALYFLKRLEFFHEIRQNNGGAFVNDTFKKFHINLIKETLHKGLTQVLRVMAGEKEVGYLYSLIHNNYVYAYQTGFNYDLLQGNTARPGLVTFSEAINYNLKKGMKTFDLMARDPTGYKKRVTVNSNSMSWDMLQRKSMNFYIENILKMIKYRIKNKCPIYKYFCL